MNITTISTYSAEDEAKIAAAYTLEDGSVDIDAIDAAIASGDTSIADIEDLISYRLDQTGEVPSAFISSPDSVAYLWEDPEAVGTMQEWRREYSDPNAQMVSDLTSFLSAGGVDVSTIADADAFILENLANQNSGDFDPSQYDDVTNLVTNMVTIMMKFGNPGMALLAYVLGFDAAVSEEDVNDDVSYSIDETAQQDGTVSEDLEPTDTSATNADITAAAVDGGESADVTTSEDEALPGEYVAVEGEMVATEGVTEGVETDGVMGTADEVEGATVGYVENTGLGDVVKDLQGTAIDIISEAQASWQDVIEDIASIDTDDTQEAAMLNAENNKKMEDIKKIITSMEEFIKMSQDILDSVIETAGALNEKQVRVWMDIMR